LGTLGNMINGSSIMRSYTLITSKHLGKYKLDMIRWFILKKELH